MQAIDEKRPLRILLFCILAAAGCSNNPTTPLQAIDLAQPAVGDMAGQPPEDLAGQPGDMAQAQGCSGSYTTASIATMRQGASGCYQLAGVVTLAVSPTTTNSKSVRIYAQDAAGGDYSAVRIYCSSTSTSHPCTVLTTAKNILAGRALMVTGTYVKSSAANGGFEQFYPDTISDTGSGTAPAPAAVAETDLERGATTSSTSKPMAAYYFQMVTATISDKLKMFDWSPPEFSSTSGSCKQYGFGLIPTSDGSAPGAACNGTTQPAGQTTVNPHEVLVSTDFYSGFKYTSDCTCGPMYSDPVPTAGQGVTGSVTVLLNYDVPYGGTVGYVYLDPLLNASFMIQ